MHRSAFSQPFVNSIEQLKSAVHSVLTTPSEIEVTESKLDRMLEIYESKDRDYSGNKKPMENLRASEEFGIEAWRGVLLRMGDKYRRIKSYEETGTYHVADESVEDTLIDLSNYSILCALLYSECTGVDIRITSCLHAIALYSLLVLTGVSERPKWRQELEANFSTIKELARLGMQD